MGTFLTPAPEVDNPTYEIVDTVERFDMRDKAISRVNLVPGSPEYKDYYSRKPELEEWDAELRGIRARSWERNWKKDPVNEQICSTLFHSMAVLGQRSIVDGTVDWKLKPGRTGDRLNVNPVEMTAKIKAFGNYLGAREVRITKLKKEWVYTHYAARFGEGYYGKPVDDMDYENIICMTVMHDPEMKKIGRGCAQEAEDGWRYTYASLISVIMADFIRGTGWEARPLPSFNAPYLVVPTFIDAGIGEQGRHAFVVSKEYGCNWRPGAVATNMPLELDKSVDFGLQDFCEKCKLCAEYCPSGAISFGGKEIVRGVRRWDLDIEKCKQYWERLGHSCCICQSVCPWNHPGTWLHDWVRELSQRFPLLNSLFIKGDKLIYGGFKPAQPPEWMITPGIIKES